MAKKKEEEQVTTAPVEEAVESAVADAPVEEETVVEDLVAKEIKACLLKTKREGIKDLVEYMEDSGFFTAPASGGNHSNQVGGLAAHSLNVLHMAERMSFAFYGGKNISADLRNSIVIAALLHDLGKIGDYDKQMYVPNILKSGKQSEAKPWMRNKQLSNVPHSVRSVKLATLFIDLTEDEEWAILAHDGLYDFMKYEIMGHETELYMLIHFADLWSSKVLEKSESEGEE